MEQYNHKRPSEISAQGEADLIVERIKPLFKRLRGHQYHILVANVRSLKQINFFFEDESEYDLDHSIPLHTLKNTNLGYFESVMRLIRKQTNLTVKLRGFQGMRWHSNGKFIQKPNDYEQGEMRYK